MEVSTLTCDDLLAIHEALVVDFAESSDPIAPPGVKSMDLLESAISRQHTSLGGRLKYPDALSSAATLLYGICCNHAFNNGNKRAAVVAMLVHLDGNRLALHATSQGDLFDMVIGVANHRFGMRVNPRKSRGAPDLRLSSDDQVKLVSEWLGKRAQRVVRGERQLTYRELRRLLENFGFYLENPDRNHIEIVRYEEERVGLIRKRIERVRKRIGSIGYPGDHQVVGTKEIKRIRQLCKLTEPNGIDSAAFYDRAAVIDEFVNKYRTLLRRLARR